jgi:hypothetical protein
MITDRVTWEHGAGLFGKDYAFSLWNWVTTHYEKIETIGSEPLTGNGFGITIMRRKQL